MGGGLRISSDGGDWRILGGGGGCLQFHIFLDFFAVSR